VGAFGVVAMELSKYGSRFIQDVNEFRATLDA
jgi:hypothetical protein